MSEQSEAKRDGSKLQKNSGRGQYQKGDARLDIFTIDYKESNKSFTLNKKNWGKVCMDAWKNGNTEPALKVILGEGNDKTRLWVVAEPIIEDYIRLRRLEENGEI